MQNFPPVRWAMRHPRLAAWIVLAVGMALLVVNEAREVGLQPSQWVALLVATVLVAGLCVWIISWEDEDETKAEVVTVTPTPTENAPMTTVSTESSQA
jgi:hypothetical protein